MREKKIPMRMCVVTRERLPKRELLRIVKTPEGDIVIDETGKKNGKGCYVKKDREVVLEAQKKRILERVFETDINEKIYEDILNIID